MSNKLYYKTIEVDIKNKNDTNSKITLLTAKQAREMTDEALMNKLKTLLYNVEKTAKEGKNQYSFNVAKKYDYDKIFDIIVNVLDYKIIKKQEYNDFFDVTITW